MRKTTWVFAMLVFLPMCVWAQRDTLPRQLPPRVSLSVDMLPLIALYRSSVVASADFRLRRNLLLTASGGYFFYSQAYASYEGETYKGPRARLGFKHVFDQSVYYNIFWGFTGKYHRVSNWRYEDYLRQGGQYQEVLPTERRIVASGGQGWLGGQLFFGKKRRGFMEFSIGAGYARLNVQQMIPEDAELIEDGSFRLGWRPGSHNILDIAVSLKVGAAIW
jgi:hypothetical protein